MWSSKGRFREELGLNGSPGTPAASALVAAALEIGFNRAAFVDPSRLAVWAERWPAAASEIEAHWVLSPGEWSRRSSILVCCLSCFRREAADLSTPGDPHGLIAPFARAHYYRLAVDLLGRLARRAERDQLHGVPWKGVPRRSVRIFSNSRMPEKQLLAASGLASVGKNGLCIVPGLGSLFVISGMVLPIPTEAMLGSAAPAIGDAAAPGHGPAPAHGAAPGHGPAPAHGAAPSHGAAPADPCGTCDRCLRACSMGALTAPGVLDRDLCLQAWATRAEPFPPGVLEKWGTRLYGCQDCQSCCPHNARLTEEALEAPGELGPSVPLLPFLSEREAALKDRLRGTALGMSWITPSSLVRNALAAAGARGDPGVHQAVAAHVSSEGPAQRAAARWAVEKT